jgi:hypothetical protein
MKRRGWRVALTVATLGLALVAGLVALNWEAVRNQVEAWRFVVTRETEEILPDPMFINTSDLGPVPAFTLLSSCTGRPVVCDRTKDNRPFYSSTQWDKADKDFILNALKNHGFRVIEQRFPRLAYLVVGYPPDSIRFVVPKQKSRALMQRQQAEQRAREEEQRALESRSLKYPPPARKAFEKDA